MRIMRTGALDALGRLEAMARRRRTGLPSAPDADSLAAVERCRQCHYRKLCDEALASADGDGRAFCPNTHYLAALRARLL